MPFTAAEIAEQVQGEVIGNSAVVLKGFAPAETAQAGDLTFAENEEYLTHAQKSAASAVIVSGKANVPDKVLILVKNTRVAFAKALTLFFPDPVFPAGVHPTAVIAPAAYVDPSAHIGPNCVIGARTKIGPRAALIAGVCVAQDCTLAEGVVLFPNVTIYSGSQLGQRVRIHSGTVIGSDGFGYVFDTGAHRKVPQVGNVIIGVEVEIGANVTIDRGALGATVIGRGTKIDNLVQIGHNVQVGEHCLIVAQVGIAGSCKLGNYVVLAGQVGIAGHLKIGDKAVLGAQSGVLRDVPAGEKWMGTFAQPDKDYKRQYVAMRELPGLLRRVAALEKKLGER